MSTKYIYIRWVILAKSDIKMAGYSSSSFLYIYTPKWSQRLYISKNEQDQYPAILTKQAWSIKELLSFLWKKDIIFLWDSV